jgi:regulation of enolase protein 1 (concanavalin A-like superfamily)
MPALLGQELDELNGPVSAVVSGELVEISAGAGTDLFCAPDRSAPTLNAPALLLEAPAGDFTLSARIESELRETYDAGALILWHDREHWAKFAVELSPQGRPTIVSVVTRVLSDDCNSIALERPDAQLRIARIDDAFALHVKVGADWSLIRHFTLAGGPARPGFLAQSPTGAGCSARFSALALEARRLDDIRDGT